MNILLNAYIYLITPLRYFLQLMQPFAPPFTAILTHCFYSFTLIKKLTPSGSSLTSRVQPLFLILCYSYSQYTHLTQYSMPENKINNTPINNQGLICTLPRPKSTFFARVCFRRCKEPNAEHEHMLCSLSYICKPLFMFVHICFFLFTFVCLCLFV